jgi:hypothetical protein
MSGDGLADARPSRFVFAVGHTTEAMERGRYWMNQNFGR